MPKASHHYEKGNFNFQTVTINDSTDTAVIRIYKYGWSREYQFKVQDYCKGMKDWKTIEDEEVKEKNGIREEK